MRSYGTRLVRELKVGQPKQLEVQVLNGTEDRYKGADKSEHLIVHQKLTRQKERFIIVP